MISKFTILASLIVFIMPQNLKNKSLGVDASLPHGRNGKPSMSEAFHFMEKEIWVTVNGHEGFYEVSSIGNMRGLKRTITIKDGRIFKYKEGSLKVNKSSNGYGTVCLRGQWYRVHRLVAIAFIPNPHKKKEVNHINGDKMDNRVSNLEWATKSENTIHSFRYLNRKNAVPKRGSAHVLSRGVVAIFKTGETMAFGAIQEAARELNCSAGLICMVLNGKRSHTHGIKFKYAN